MYAAIPAGIITNSDGNGTNELSIIIRIRITKYPKLLEKCAT
jgi:hypothetical protein